MCQAKVASYLQGMDHTGSRLQSVYLSEGFAELVRMGMVA
jgi:hypothetical protein